MTADWNLALRQRRRVMQARLMLRMGPWLARLRIMPPGYFRTIDRLLDEGLTIIAERHRDHGF